MLDNIPWQDMLGHFNVLPKQLTPQHPPILLIMSLCLVFASFIWLLRNEPSLHF